MKENNKFYNIFYPVMIFLIILLIGASIGAQYSDNNWKHDVLKSSIEINNITTYLSYTMNGEILYFKVQEITPYNYKEFINISEINITN